MILANSMRVVSSKMIIHRLILIFFPVAACTKLGLNYETRHCKVFLEDGTMLTEDDDLKCESMVGGKLLFIRNCKESAKTSAVSEKPGTSVYSYLKHNIIALMV